MSGAGWPLTIGEAAARIGLGIHTLRFYERERLFAWPVKRDAGGRRVYSENDIEWLEICSSFRAAGMPLAEIRRYAELVGQGPGNEAERLDVLRRQHQRVIKEIDALAKSQRLIEYKLDLYEQRLRDGTADHLWTAAASSPAEANGAGQVQVSR